MKPTIPYCRCVAASAGAALALASASAPALAQGADCPDFDILFSLDIGSDTELSDPFMDGDEAFDPGDAYVGGVLLGGPANGFINDALFFGFDPLPDPFVAGSAAPTCTGTPIQEVIQEYFDLDGIDVVDLQLDLNPDQPLTAPIPFQNTPCILPAQKLFLSWDDDVAAHFVDPGCPVPVASPSPFSGGIFGTTGGVDEVFSVAVTTSVPTALGAFMPELDERGVSPSMGPNPDAGEEDDDDVDALDTVLAPVEQLTLCPWVYWSPDHEAPLAALGLDPGDIYVSPLFGPSGFAFAIDEVTHLGIPDSADVDAFEFVGAEFPDAPGGGLFLALLFSVDDDDPLTPPDESGGLDPSVVYISYFMGFSTPFTPPLGEDIDAISNWCAIDQTDLGACCFCDGSCADGFATAADCAAAGGIFQGLGSTCATVTCEEYGACCLCDGVCIDGLTLADCESGAAGFVGKWQGPCTDCANVVCEPYGACCLCDGTCVDMVTRVDCTDPAGLNGKFQGACTDCNSVDCEPFGACCLPDGTCVDMLTLADCEGPAFGGIYQGDCTNCGATSCLEACCFCDGSCIDLPVGDCLAQGGKPQGPGTSCNNIDCEPYGACCLQDGTCVDMVTLAVCEAPGGLGGIYQGDCTDCSDVNCAGEPGACCFACEQYPGGPPIACVDVTTLADCCALQGLFIPGATCATADCDVRLCPGDLNGDNRVDVFDFGILGSNFGSCVPTIFGRCDGDLNCDGCVDVFDFGIFSASFGCSKPPITPQCCAP